ncbi:MAG: protein kinase [Acidobacteria bacterium]|nr:protein kinase [Acidobacteriota bacterium]
MEHHRWLAEIAAEIADGQAIDWPEVEARAHDEHDLEVIRRLQSIQRLTLAQTALSAAPAEEELVSSWGPLTILERVGRGTFGDVYRAWDPRLDRHVALKILRRREISTPGEESALIEEARLMARVRHPNIVTVYGAERIDGRVGIWMEFVEGRTLEQELRDKGPLSPDDVVSVATDLCAALHAVHQAGLLHRDLKAQNVMRSNDGRILLTDFGAGRERALGAEGEQVELAGTPLYLAPEVLNGEPASVRSDLYSLGVLLFYLSTGTYPLTGRTLREIRAAHKDRGPAVILLPAPLSRSTASTIHRLLDPSPDHRPADADQARGALLSASAHGKQRRLRLWAGLALGAVALFFLINPLAPSQTRHANAQGFRRVGPEWGSGVAPGNPSPDGRWLVCLDQAEVASGATSRLRFGQLARCDVETGHVTPIGEPGPGRRLGAAIPQLSSDGRRIAYVATDRQSVRMVDVDGMNDHEVASLAMLGESKSRIEYLSLSEHVLAVAASTGSALAQHDFLVVEEDKSHRSLGRVSGHLAGFNLSPDGRWLAYSTDSDGGHLDLRKLDLRKIDTQSGEDVLVVRGGYAPIWAPNGEDLHYMGDRAGISSFMRVRVIDRHVTVVQAYARQGVEPLGMSQDGTMFFSVHSARWETYVAGIDFTASYTAVPKVFGTISVADLYAVAADWSPDGRWLAFSSEEPLSRIFGVGQAKPFLTLREFSSGREETLPLPPGTAPIYVHWSRSGSSLAVCCQPSQEGAIWSIINRGDGTVSRQFALGGDSGDLNPQNVAISPDGTTVFYAVGTGDIRKLSIDSKRDAIVYSSSDATLGDERQLETGLALSADGQRLAFLTAGATAVSVRIMDVSSGHVTTLASFPNPTPGSQQLQVGGWAMNDRWLTLVYLLAPEPLKGMPATQQSRTWAIDIGSGASTHLFWAPAAISDPRINAGANRMVFSDRRVSRTPIEVWTLTMPASSKAPEEKTK